IYISERRSNFCDVHYHPWLGEVENPSGDTDNVNPVAIAFDRHGKGSNGAYADGHAKWSAFARSRAPFEGHELYGEYQAF
ncbi:H-X9-DG-CTERM domain-containing protein, partial [Escherichia coli]|uniref:H-X9-DG-CTERM domain-containing protein n=1 Tax=Escherichia coli TaxID=562 RepID=UPI003CE49458